MSVYPIFHDFEVLKDVKLKDTDKFNRKHLGERKPLPRQLIPQNSYIGLIPQR